MAHEPMRHLFFRCKFAACITNTLFIDMKKQCILKSIIQPIITG